MTHAQLVEKAVQWLRACRCGVVLSEQACVSGEMPDAIGWKRANHSVLIECKISRADFLADRDKPFRQEQELGLGCERFYLTPPALLQLKELPPGWGLLELRQRKVEVVRRSARNLRTPSGLAYEMNLLLASLRRVEIRIEPQTITEFLKWKNRMQQYNGGACPTGIDVYFDNVGGDHLEAAMANMRERGRIAVCGSISGYNNEAPAPGPRNMSMIVTRRLTIRGFLVLDWGGESKAFYSEVAPLVANGTLKWRETVVDGLANAPQAFIDMMKGANTGKMVVKI